jgi:hypothetical protein
MRGVLVHEVGLARALAASAEPPDHNLGALPHYPIKKLNIHHKKSSSSDLLIPVVIRSVP